MTQQQLAELLAEIDALKARVKNLELDVTDLQSRIS